MSKWESNIEPYIREVEEWAGRGAKTKEIADKLGVGYSTLRKCIKEHQELAAALNRGRARAKRVIEKALAQKDPPGPTKTTGGSRMVPYVKSTTPRPDQQGRHRGPFERNKKRISNLQLAHWTCNRQKSDKLLAATGEHKAVEVISNRVLPQSMDWASYRAD